MRNAVTLALATVVLAGAVLLGTSGSPHPHRARTAAFAAPAQAVTLAVYRR